MIYAVDRGDDRNPVLMGDFPGRSYYRYRDGQLTRLDGPGAGSGRPMPPGVRLAP
ncbi:MAG: hypothetical protein R2849_11815 [Thermomicrobiales bacterium]